MPERWLAASTTLLATATLAACGDDDAPRILDTERIERAIEGSIQQKRDMESDVSCPSGTEQKKGVTFRCVATLRSGVKTTFVVTQDDSRGAVHYVGVRE